MQGEGTVSLVGMEKAGRVVKSFVVSFFPILGLPLSSYLDMHHVLLWAESLVYSMDLAVEQAQREGLARLGIEREAEALTEGLRGLGLLTPPALDDVSRFVRYFELETELLAAEAAPTIERLREVWWLRSSDMRLLATLTAQLAGVADSYQANGGLLTCIDGLLRCSEVVADTADYEADEKVNSFNLIRMFARIYGRGEARRRLLDELDAIRSSVDMAAAGLEAGLRERVQAATAEWWGFLRLPDLAPGAGPDGAPEGPAGAVG